MTTRKICAVTGGRPDYGLLYWVLQGINDDPRLELQLVVTAMHLSPEFGLTYRQIEADGFDIDAKVEMLLSGDTPVAIAKSIGLGTIGFADAFETLKPDILLLMGDRFELLAAAQAALVRRLPIAHIAGGDTTEGAYDEAIRHSITKMSHVHFATNAIAKRRILQLGEDPALVHDVGSPGLDYIRTLKRLTRKEVAALLGIEFRERNLLVTFHPVTLEGRSSEAQFRELLAALEAVDFPTVIFTRPNADNDGRILNEVIDEYVAASAGRAVAHTHLGQDLYLNTIAQVDVVAGNSSSGLYEVPSFRKPTVNIGSRQRGRLRASSVIDCSASRDEIVDALQRALALNCTDVVNPYGDGHSAPRIVEILASLPAPEKIVQKRFFEWHGETEGN